MNFNLNNFKKSVICENAITDTEVEAVVNGNCLDLYI